MITNRVAGLLSSLRKYRSEHLNKLLLFCILSQNTLRRMNFNVFSWYGN